MLNESSDKLVVRNELLSIYHTLESKGLNMSSLTKKTMRCKPEEIIVENLKEDAYEIRAYLYAAMAGHGGTIYSPHLRNTTEVMNRLIKRR